MEPAKPPIPLDYESRETVREMRIERTVGVVTVVLPGYGTAMKLAAILGPSMWLASIIATITGQIVVLSMVRRMGWSPITLTYEDWEWLLAEAVGVLFLVYTNIQDLRKFVRNGHAPRKITASDNGVLMENIGGFGRNKLIERSKIDTVVTKQSFFRRTVRIRTKWRWRRYVDVAWGEPAKMELIAAALNEGLALSAETSDHI
jgi:hypothetical protein